MLLGFEPPLLFHSHSINYSAFDLYSNGTQGYNDFNSASNPLIVLSRSCKGSNIDVPYFTSRLTVVSIFLILL